MPVWMPDAGKRLLEAIALLGSWQEPPDSSPGVPEELERLVELGLVGSETVGETRTRNGRRRYDGVEMFTLTSMGKLWLERCEPYQLGMGHDPGTFQGIAWIERREAALQDIPGRCVACNTNVEGCASEAREQRCPHCGEHQVYGCAQLFRMLRDYDSRGVRDGEERDDTRNTASGAGIGPSLARDRVGSPILTVATTAGTVRP
jgi:predicted RNA-binding Zn-ribbon protein involved in translation (DUF1610 family)